MTRLPQKALFALTALPAVLRAAVRVQDRLGRLPFDRAVAELRAVPAFRFGALAEQPAWLEATAALLLPLLPPWRCGPCLKRSLIALDLWGRCGLEPSLHLGFDPSASAAVRGHAWVTALLPDGSELMASAPGGHREAFVL